jgi:Fe-S cluster assembly protein SufD
MTVVSTPFDDLLTARGAALPEGLPHRRIENWRYADWRTLVKRPYGAATVTGAVLPGPWDAVTDAVVVENGALVSQPTSNPLVQITHVIPGEDPGPSNCGHRDDSGSRVFARDDSVYNLNTLLAPQHIVITIPDGAVLDAPLHLDIRNSDPAGASFAHITVRLGAGAVATVVESVRTAPSGDGYISSAIAYELGAGAMLTRAHADTLAADAVAYVRADVALAERSHFTSYGVVRGARALRSELHITHAGLHAAAAIHTATVVTAGRAVNHFVVADHTVGPGTTVERFKTTVAGGTASFQGKIHVAKGADGVDARQSHQGLLLDDAASINAKPELEIYADDVACAHGATCGALDNDALFYLMVRGIPEDAARALMAEAFIADVFDDAPEAIQTALLSSLRGSVADKAIHDHAPWVAAPAAQARNDGAGGAHV